MLDWFSIRRIALVLLTAAMFFAVTPALAQPNRNSGKWPLEELSLRTGGKVLKGLIESESASRVEFVEVVRTPGQAPYVVVRTIQPRDIADRRPLPPAERTKLIARVDRIRNRAHVQRQKIEAIVLRRGPDKRWQYQGTRFALTSTADEQTSRRAIVRLEQMFAAFRQVLPPQHAAPKRPLRILFFGSLAEYRDFLSAENLKIDNPAFYSPRQNVVAAGSELAAVAAEIAATEARHREVMAEYRSAADTQRASLREALKNRKQLGWSDEDCRELVQATERRLGGELEHVRRQILLANRRQESSFDQQTRRLFARLYHEAFHAYVENFVFDSSRYDVPVWLNEGLAQLFESARVDDEELRLDVVDLKRLAALRVELNRQDSLSVRDMLYAGREAFLVEHQSSGTSERHYLIAWAVAYDLTHEQNLFASDRLIEYVDKKHADENRTRRFEQLVGSKLADFQRRWRQRMLSLAIEKKHS